MIILVPQLTICGTSIAHKIKLTYDPNIINYSGTLNPLACTNALTHTSTVGKLGNMKIRVLLMDALRVIINKLF